MYVRAKVIKGHTYYYLVEGTRVGSKVKQKVIRYLGKNPGAYHASAGRSPTEPERPIFRGFPDLSTSVLEELIGRHTVSKQFITDLVSDPTRRQAERHIITAVLAEFPGKTIAVQAFADGVKRALLPLKRGTIWPEFEKYEHVNLPKDLRGDVRKYSEHVYTSPIHTTAGSIHFHGALDHNNYFAHTRVEDIAKKTRRVIEVQSDLFQKGRLEVEGIIREPAPYIGLTGGNVR